MSSGFDSQQITRWLEAWSAGDRAALDELVSASYPKLHELAENLLRGELHRHTLQATGLIHELYLVLRQQRAVTTADRQQFYAFAAYLIRLILLNRARERRSAKRGSGMAAVPLSDQLPGVDAASEDMIDVHRAFEELSALDARKAELLGMVVFLGCSVAEAAGLAGISLATAERDLRYARAWVRARLAGPPAKPAPG